MDPFSDLPRLPTPEFARSHAPTPGAFPRKLLLAFVPGLYICSAVLILVGALLMTPEGWRKASVSDPCYVCGKPATRTVVAAYLAEPHVEMRLCDSCEPPEWVPASEAREGELRGSAEARQGYLGVVGGIIMAAAGLVLLVASLPAVRGLLAGRYVARSAEDLIFSSGTVGYCQGVTFVGYCILNRFLLKSHHGFVSWPFFMATVVGALLAISVADPLRRLAESSRLKRHRP